MKLSQIALIHGSSSVMEEMDNNQIAGGFRMTKVLQRKQFMLSLLLVRKQPNRPYLTQARISQQNGDNFP